MATTERSAVEASQCPTQVAHRLLGALLVLDEGEADETLAAGAEADAGGDGDVGLLDQVSRELDGLHVAVLLGDRRPHEHGPLRRFDVPPDALEAATQVIAT